MSSKKQLKLGAIISYISIAINIISGLLYTPWMINSIGKENFGLYTLALSVITLFVFDFGLSAAITRFIAKYLAQNKQDKVNNCVGLVYRLYILIDILLFIILFVVFFFIPTIYKELTPDEITKFKIIYSMAAMYAVVSFPFIPINGILTAYECFIQLKICDVIHKIVIIITMTICLLMDYGLYSLVFSNIFAGILIIFLKIICINKYTSLKVKWSYFNKTELKELATYSGWVTIISIAQRCIFNIAPSILGMLSGSSAIAVLGIAITFEGYTYTFANALNGMFLPKVSRIVNYNGDILPLMIRIGRIQIYIIGLIISGFICFGNDFINLWVGDSFKDSYICTMLIILPSIFHLPQTIGNETIFAQNKVKDLAVIFILMAVLNILGAIVFAKPMGAVGICFSIFIAYLFRTIGMDYIIYKKMNIDIFAFFNHTFVKLCLPLILCLIVGLSINWFLYVEGWLGIFIKIVLYCIAYIGIIYLLGMNEYEKNLVKTPFSHIKNIK